MAHKQSRVAEDDITREWSNWFRGVKHIFTVGAVYRGDLFDVTPTSDHGFLIEWYEGEDDEGEPNRSQVLKDGKQADQLRWKLAEDWDVDDAVEDTLP